MALGSSRMQEIIQRQILISISWSGTAEIGRIFVFRHISSWKGMIEYSMLITSTLGMDMKRLNRGRFLLNIILLPHMLSILQFLSI